MDAVAGRPNLLFDRLGSSDGENLSIPLSQYINRNSYDELIYSKARSFSDKIKLENKTIFYFGL